MRRELTREELYDLEKHNSNMNTDAVINEWLTGEGFDVERHISRLTMYNNNNIIIFIQRE